MSVLCGFRPLNRGAKVVASIVQQSLLLNIGMHAIIVVAVLILFASDSFGQFGAGIAVQGLPRVDNDVPDDGMRRFQITDHSFDQMAYGVVGRQPVFVVDAIENQRTTSSDTAITMFRKRMEASAAHEIDVMTIFGEFTLSETQSKKLRLAARGDIEDHIDRLEALRRKLTSKLLDEQEYMELLSDLQALHAAQQFGLLGENSLFRKMLDKTLTPDQMAKYRTLERDYQVKMIDGVLVQLAATANIEWAVDTDERTSITERRQRNRRRFIDVLLDHESVPKTQNVYLREIVLLEIGRRENELKLLIQEESWNKLEAKIAETRRLEAILRRSGNWPDIRPEEELSADDFRKGLTTR